MLFDEIKQYAMELKVGVDSGLRKSTIMPVEPAFLYGKENKVLVPFSFSYWVLPDRSVEYRSRLADAVEEKREKHTLLPSPPVSNAPALYCYITCCERLLGLPYKDFGGSDFFREAVAEFCAPFERIAAMNKRRVC
ncbi:MAG: hypothetical protein WC613_04910 [Candidatus Aenigmatarchaeota archaeon]